MKLCFELSLFITTPNSSIVRNESSKYIQIIQQFIDINIAKLITLYLVHESNYLRWITFDEILPNEPKPERLDEPEYEFLEEVDWNLVEQIRKYKGYQAAKLQTRYSCKNHIVDFSFARYDVINVRTKLLSKDIAPIYYVNVYCMGKDDELWLGIIKKDAYTPSNYVRCDNDGLFYYGGRECIIQEKGGSVTDKCGGWDGDDSDCNHGGIQGRNKVIKHPLESYSAGDWINFEINLVNKTCVFYKNGIKQHQTDKEWFPDGNCYFMIQLDGPDDIFYIEQGHEPQCRQ